MNKLSMLAPRLLLLKNCSLSYRSVRTVTGTHPEIVENFTIKLWNDPKHEFVPVDSLLDHMNNSGPNSIDQKKRKMVEGLVAERPFLTIDPRNGGFTSQDLKQFNDGFSPKILPWPHPNTTWLGKPVVWDILIEYSSSFVVDTDDEKLMGDACELENVPLKPVEVFGMKNFMYEIIGIPWSVVDE